MSMAQADMKQSAVMTNTDAFFALSASLVLPEDEVPALDVAVARMEERLVTIVGVTVAVKLTIANVPVLSGMSISIVETSTSTEPLMSSKSSAGIAMLVATAP